MLIGSIRRLWREYVPFAFCFVCLEQFDVDEKGLGTVIFSAGRMLTLLLLHGSIYAAEVIALLTNTIVIALAATETQRELRDYRNLLIANALVDYASTFIGIFNGEVKVEKNLISERWDLCSKLLMNSKTRDAFRMSKLRMVCGFTFSAIRRA